MKTILLLLSLSSLSFAAGIDETISKIELEKNAKCEYTNSSSSFCLNNYCRQRVFYTCTSNDGDFKVKLGIRYYNIGGRITNILVKNVSFIY
jgi:hypothetical protein